MRFLLIAVTLMLTACANIIGGTNSMGFPGSAPQVPVPSESPNIRGTLNEITPGPSGGTLLVQDSGTGARASLRLTPSSRLAKADGTYLSFRELAVGQTVEAWYDGPVAESDPVQVNARAVRLVK